MIVIELSIATISVSRFRGNGYFYFVLTLFYYFKFLIVRMNYTCNDKNIWEWFKSQNPTHVFHKILTSYLPHLHLLLISPSSSPPLMVRNPDFQASKSPLCSMWKIWCYGSSRMSKEVKLPVWLQILGLNIERLVKNCF